MSLPIALIAIMHGFAALFVPLFLGLVSEIDVTRFVVLGNSFQVKVFSEKNQVQYHQSKLKINLNSSDALTP